MKRFRFGLERVRSWRHSQMEIEEAHIERLFSELADLDRKRQDLEREREQAEQTTLGQPSVEAVELALLDSYHGYVQFERQRLANRRRDCERRIEAQRTKLMEARKRFRLLDRLKERELKVWTAEQAREIENQAGELYLTQWQSRRRDSVRRAGG